MRSRNISARTANRLKDEVYRQMLRLEGGRPEAQVLLAVALLKAWTTLERQPPACDARQWLRKLSPVCLRLIEDACRAGCNGCEPHAPGSGRESAMAPVAARVSSKSLSE